MAKTQTVRHFQRPDALKSCGWHPLLPSVGTLAGEGGGEGETGAGRRGGGVVSPARSQGTWHKSPGCCPGGRVR